MKGGKGGGGGKETRYILYDSVIAFPRTNIARRPSERKKTSALIVALPTSPPRRLYSISPRNPFPAVAEFLR